MQLITHLYDKVVKIAKKRHMWQPTTITTTIQMYNIVWNNIDMKSHGQMHTKLSLMQYFQSQNLF